MSSATATLDMRGGEKEKEKEKEGSVVVIDLISEGKEEDRYHYLSLRESTDLNAIIRSLRILLRDRGCHTY